MAKKVNKEEGGDKAEGKKTKAAKPAKVKATKADASDQVMLKDLAKEAGMTPVAARVKLRTAEVERDGRWSWEPNSPGHKAARKALGL